ncbi:MAG: PilZ domain-containing protein [Candidatus Aureabacteria bacterium]|nr:PilZ domain-containing protein [Candidatus Auribacterota bacterium]
MNEIFQPDGFDYNGIERRKYIRFSYHYPVRHRRMGEDTYQESESDNISLGGVMFYSSRSYGVGENIDLELDFPLGSGHQIIAVSAMVCWIQKKEMPPYSYSMGVSFNSLSEDQLQQLQTMVQTFLEYKQKQFSLVTEDTLEKNKEEARILFIKGLEYFRNDLLDEAIDAFSRVIQLIPSHAAAYSYRAYSHERKGESRKAEEDYIKAKELGGF